MRLVAFRYNRSLKNIRILSNLMARRKADCIVVGGGLIGMFTALELANTGLSVVLLERGKIGQGAPNASWSAGGILSPLYPWRYPEAVNKLCSWSQTHYPALLERLGPKTASKVEYHQCGMIILDKVDAEKASSWAIAHPQLHNRPDMLLKHEVAQYDLAVRAPEEGAIRMSKVAQLRPPRLLRSLQKALKRANVYIVQNAEVQGFTWAGDRISGVRTGDTLWEGDQVVITAGAWSGTLLESVGMPNAIKPIRGQMLQYKMKADIPQHIVMHKGVYVIPRLDGTVLIGATEEDVAFDQNTTREARDQLRDAATRFIPSLAKYKVEQQWSGFRPCTPDNAPIIGRHPLIENLWLNTGHFKNGVVMAPAAARLLTDLLTANHPIVDPSPFAADRFQVLEVASS